MMNMVCSCSACTRLCTDNPTRVSIFVDRADTSLVLCHIWEEESHEKHKEMFNSILRYWQLVKNYEWENE